MPKENNKWLLENKRAKLAKELQNWRPSTIKKPQNKADFFKMLIVGASNTGKTYFLLDLLKNTLRDRYDTFITVSPKPDNIELYKQILPGKLFYNDLPDDVIRKFQIYKM